MIDNWRKNLHHHSTIKNIPERLELFDEVELIRKSIEHNLKINNSNIEKGDFVRLLNKRGTFEKERQLKLFVENDERNGILTFPYGNNYRLTPHANAGDVELMGKSFI